MGDEHDRARVVGEKRLEPVDRLDVEVVGRLVEQQQVGLADQRARQQHAAPPAARQRVDAGVGRQLEAREHQLHALLEAPAVALLELVLQASQAVRAAPASLCSADLDGGVVVAPRPASLRSPRPSATTSKTVRRWRAARPARAGRRAAPGCAPHRARRRAGCSPLRICSSVDLPVPLRPMIATRSPGSICSEASSSSGRWPKAIETGRA